MAKITQAVLLKELRALRRKHFRKMKNPEDEYWHGFHSGMHNAFNIMIIKITETHKPNENKTKKSKGPRS